MSERMRSRIHLDGGHHVDVLPTAAVINEAWDGGPLALLSTQGADGLCLIPLGRIVWVSTIPQGTDDG